MVTSAARVARAMGKTPHRIFFASDSPMMDSLVQRLAPDSIIFDQKEKVSNDGRGYIMSGLVRNRAFVAHRKLPGVDVGL